MRIFKQETGTTPVDFLIQIRLERAKKLLISSMESITDIAYTCGFNSSSHFATSFLKKFNATPSDFRKLK
jgi:AraC-like DNA-binding protein